MAGKGRFQKAWEHFNSESDERVFQIIKKKYFGLFQLSGMYTSFNGIWLYFSIVQIVAYFSLIFYHWVLMGISITKFAYINFILFSQMIHYMVLATVTMVIMGYVIFRRVEFARFHKIIHGGVYDYNEDDGEIFTLFNDEIKKEWRRSLLVPGAVAFTVVSAILVGPVLDKYGTFNPDETADPSIKYNLPVPAYYPYDTADPFVALVTGCIQVLTGCVVGFTMCAGGLGYVCLTQTLAREFRILLHAAENIERRATLMHVRHFGTKPRGKDYEKFQSQTYIICIIACYKKLYEHHLRIIEVGDDVSSILGFPNLVAFGFGPVVLALALLATTISGGQLPGTTFSAILFCGIEVLYLFLFSFLGQRLTDLSEDFRRKLYDVKWYYCKKNVLVNYSILQVGTLKPFVLYAPFGTMPSNLETFSGLMNSAYSFYNLMLAAY